MNLISLLVIKKALYIYTFVLKYQYYLEYL